MGFPTFVNSYAFSRFMSGTDHYAQQCFSIFFPAAEWFFWGVSKHNKNNLCTRWSWRELIQKAKNHNFIRALAVLGDLSVSGLVDPTSGSTVWQKTWDVEWFMAADDWLVGALLRILWVCEVCMLLLDPKALFTDLIDLRQICIGKGIPVLERTADRLSQRDQWF